MKKKIIIVFLSFLFVSAGQYNVVAQKTGTRIKDADSAYMESVVWFSQPREITDIRLLLQDGKKEAAVEKARDYVESLENVGGNEAKQRRYYALNALCAALTSTGQTKEAISSCSRAIKINPSLWEALNTRGTAYYVSNQIDLALKDYRAALSKVQNSEPLTDLIQHNIELAKAKKSESK